MTTPDDFPRHRPPPEDPDLMHPGTGPKIVAVYIGGALVILAVLATIAILILH